MKKTLAILLFVPVLLLILGCGIFFLHGWCYRSIHGNIVIEQSFIDRDSTTLAEMKTTIREWSKDYGTHYDYIAELKSDGSYKTKESTFLEQGDCGNNCGHKSLPDSLKVIIKKGDSEQLLFDTMFYCDDYKFQKYDIILPTITLK